MTKTKKKQNNKKRRLLLLILLLVLTVGLVGLQTWSWFTSNRTVSVDTMQVEVRSANGLQISADGEDWDNSISLEDIFVAAGKYDTITNQLPGAMENVSSPGTVDSDGTVKMYYGKVESSSELNETTGSVDTTYLMTASDVSALVECNDMYTGSKTDDYTLDSCTGENKGYYVAFDLYFKTSSGSSSGTSQVVIDGKSSVKGIDSKKGTENTSRIGILEVGNTTYDNNNPEASGAAARELADYGNFYIWEPNAYGSGAHTDTALANASNYSITPSSSSAVPYCGINQNILTTSGTDDERNMFNIQCGKSTFVTENAVKTSASATNNKSSIELTSGGTPWSISEGITKVRVYWWVEGQDIDTENNASGHSMKLTLVFSMA